MHVVVFFILNMIMALSANLLAYHYFKKSGFAEQLVTAFLIFVAQVTFSILFLGVIIKNLGIFPILTFNSGISGMILFVLRKEIKDSVSNFAAGWLNFFKYAAGTGDYFLYFLLVLFVTQITILIIKIYYLPPHVVDVFNYHLPPVVEWFQQGKIPLLIDTPVDRVNFRALSSGLLHFWLAKFFRDAVFLELWQFFHGIFLMLVSYAIMLKIGVKKQNALRYALLIYFIPSLLIQSRTCQNHLILTTWTMVAILYLLDVFYEKMGRRIIFLAMSSGILLGIKLNSPQVISILFLALLLSRGFAKNAFFKFVKENKVKIIAGIVIILLLGGYWHIKNIILYKNPTGAYAPREFAFSSDSTPGVLKSMAETFVKNVREFPSRISDAGSNYIPGLPRISGFGIQFFVFGLISYTWMFVLVIRKRIGRNSIPAFTWIFSVLLLLSYFLYYYDLFNHRLFIFVPVIGIILWAFLLTHSGLDVKRPFSRYLDFLIAAMIIFNMTACFYPGYGGSTGNWKILFSIKNAPDRTTIKYFQYLHGNIPGQWAIIDRYISPHEPIGYFGDKYSWIFQYYDNKMTRRIYNLGSFPGYRFSGERENRLEFSPEFKTALKERNIRFIHINYRKKKVIIKDEDIEHIAGGLYRYRREKQGGSGGEE